MGGLSLLSDIRNDVAHKGMTDKFKISTLMDCWYPYEFVRGYITLLMLIMTDIFTEE